MLSIKKRRFPEREDPLYHIKFTYVNIIRHRSEGSLLSSIYQHNVPFIIKTGTEIRSDIEHKEKYRRH